MARWRGRVIVFTVAHTGLAGFWRCPMITVEALALFGGADMRKLIMMPGAFMMGSPIVMEASTWKPISPSTGLKY